MSAFQGGNQTFFNVWRPQATCKMRSTGARFCVAFMEAMVARIYQFVRPIDRVEPDQAEIILGEGESVEVKIWPMKPAAHDLETAWELTAAPSP